MRVRVSPAKLDQAEEGMPLLSKPLLPTTQELVVELWAFRADPGPPALRINKQVVVSGSPGCGSRSFSTVLDPAHQGSGEVDGGKTRHPLNNLRIGTKSDFSRHAPMVHPALEWQEIEGKRNSARGRECQEWGEGWAWSGGGRQAVEAGDSSFQNLCLGRGAETWAGAGENPGQGRSFTGHSVDPGLAGLLGQRAPRSRQPFVVTFFRASPSPIRTPRAVRPLRRRQPKKTNELPQANRLPGIFDDVHGSHGRQVCRRHELYVSFQDLGWLDWVIAPQGYSAYYCEGECSFPLGSCMNATNHAILQSLVHLMTPDAVPKACCAPTKLSATSVLYYDSSNNVILRKHRNMVVKACGCH
ncbi:PREDICTED: bone morphogenetic protein 8B-like [Mandrillus leucophaeus]|uniref:bone morphogenetic protein 8B-like n=1 Tax=Mandrillus leucophaeus TaxID=9568 RepID=UPI0005F46834|nr:PREDICTED: bone morphogenetic protein 8B-like [Mandrillus leucophaeus]